MPHLQLKAYAASLRFLATATRFCRGARFIRYEALGVSTRAEYVRGKASNNTQKTGFHPLYPRTE